VTRYPAIFVDEVLVATPKDFGFYGRGEGKGEGRYTPWKSAESHERFRADLSRAIRLALEGRAGELRAADESSAGAATLPHAELAALTDLDGKPLTRASLEGRVVLVEFWATWCPPCRGTLRWLSELKKRHGERLEVVAIAVESDEAAVKKQATASGYPFRWAMGTPALVRAFGDVSAVPTLFLFDQKGLAAGAWYGAPPALHEDAEKRIAQLTPRGRPVTDGGSDR
jgi:thiol-disulfide isomerase/thioredoxin